MLDELAIKTAVIDQLYLTGSLDDAVLINEMVVANWSRRTDLTVVNGKLHAFEIKSDFDNLNRLQGQVSTYLSRFDKVTVVTTTKFLSAVKDTLPPNVELWEVTELDSEKYIRIVKRGKTQLITNKRILCGFLHKPELVALLKQNNIISSTETPRENLISQCESLSSYKLREFVLCSLKHRYKDTFKQFQAKRNDKTKIDDLYALSKKSLLKKEYKEINIINISNSAPQKNIRFLDMHLLELKYGIQADSIQKTVLLRKVS